MKRACAKPEEKEKKKKEKKEKHLELSISNLIPRRGKVPLTKGLVHHHRSSPLLPT
jgi:hypothetical protein